MPETSFIINSIKTSDKATLEYNNDLFYVDVEKNIVTPMLNDDCGAYSKESLKELAKSYRSEKSIENDDSYSYNENYVAFSYYAKPYSLHRDLGIIDLKKSKVHYVNIPDNIIFNTLSFIDNNQSIQQSGIDNR